MRERRTSGSERGQGTIVVGQGGVNIGWGASLCAELTLDAVRVTSDKPEREAVAIGAGSETAPFLFCTFFLRLTSSGWKVMPSETMCPVT